jgi:hypothetical protein
MPEPVGPGKPGGPAGPSAWWRAVGELSLSGDREARLAGDFSFLFTPFIRSDSLPDKKRNNHLKNIKIKIP